jgi:hypothetical protein
MTTATKFLLFVSVGNWVAVEFWMMLRQAGDVDRGFDCGSGLVIINYGSSTTPWTIAEA